MKIIEKIKKLDKAQKPNNTIIRGRFIIFIIIANLFHIFISIQLIRAWILMTMESGFNIFVIMLLVGFSLVTLVSSYIIYGFLIVTTRHKINISISVGFIGLLIILIVVLINPPSGDTAKMFVIILIMIPVSCVTTNYFIAKYSKILKESV